VNPSADNRGQIQVPAYDEPLLSTSRPDLTRRGVLREGGGIRGPVLRDGRARSIAGSMHRHFERAHWCQQRVIWDTSGAHSVGLRVPGVPRLAPLAACDGGERHADHSCVVAQASAADSMSWLTSAGRDTSARWPEGTSMVVVLIPAANMRLASGGIAWSWVATRYQDGSDFQAGTHHVREGGAGQWLLDRVRHHGPDRIDAGREMRHEVVFRDPAEAVGVREQVL
jgi:hypothetical protein